MTSTTLTDSTLAQNLRDAVAAIAASGNTDDDATERMILAESEIISRLNLDADEFEQGLTPNAVAQIEDFVSKHTTYGWTYSV